MKKKKKTRTSFLYHFIASNKSLVFNYAINIKINGFYKCLSTLCDEYLKSITGYR